MRPLVGRVVKVVATVKYLLDLVEFHRTWLSLGVIGNASQLMNS